MYVTEVKQNYHWVVYATGKNRAQCTAEVKNARKEGFADVRVKQIPDAWYEGITWVEQEARAQTGKV